MPATQDPPKPDTPAPDIENPQPAPPVIAPTDDPPPDLHDDPPPETFNSSQEDEIDQAQTFAEEQLRSGNDIGLSDTTKVNSGDDDDDVQDLVDHMKDMVASGRIDMGAFRGERNDDDEEESLGPDAAQE
ncbi:MAG: hypothetical protein M3N34_00915 [Pseudomonadota bacterium]|nr:hypothetical protein [Pseudomonadota bacterium]